MPASPRCQAPADPGHTSGVDADDTFPALGAPIRRSGDAVPTLLRLVLPVLLIVLATTWPLSRFQSRPRWDAVEWVPFTRFVRPFDIAANVLLFMPFGVAFARGGTTARRVRRAVGWGLACSVAIEVGQLYTANRSATVMDLVSNSTGAWLGARWAMRRATANTSGPRDAVR